jgi:hypothetical protein
MLVQRSSSRCFGCFSRAPRLFQFTSALHRSQSISRREIQFHIQRAGDWAVIVWGDLLKASVSIQRDCALHLVGKSVKPHPLVTNRARFVNY